MKLLHCLLLLLTCHALTPAAQAATNKVVRNVNGRAILKSEVDELMRARIMELQRTATSREQFESELAVLRETITELLVDQELILKEFEPLEGTHGAKIDAMTEEMIRKQWINGIFKGDRKKFLSELANSGTSYKKFYDQQRKATISETMRGQFARPDKDYITEDEKAAWLRKNIARFRSDPRIKLWSITIPGAAYGKTPQQQLALANEIRTSLVRGADFASLARTHSTDSVRDAGGSRGWMDKTTFPLPPLWPTVAKIPAGKYSEVIPFADSIFIFWAEAREEGKMKPKAEVDELVERGIMAERRQKAGEKWVRTLRAKAGIPQRK